MIRETLQELADVEKKLPDADGREFEELSARRAQLYRALTHLTAEEKLLV